MNGRALRVVMTAVIAAACGTTAAHAQPGGREPHIGYVFPAGGQRGTTVRVLAGGQFLRRTSDALVSGEGVTARVVEVYPALRNLSREQRVELQRRMAGLARARWDALAAAGEVKGDPPRAWLARGRQDEPAEPVELPRHPLLDGWEALSLRGLLHVRQLLTDRSRRQPNAQIAETVAIELTIAEDAPPGDRELRLLGRSGLTNPLTFQVGQLREVCEVESNDPARWDPLPPEPPLDLPVVINGQVLPGDVDRLRFRGKAGQRLVIEVRARQLVPFLADAVPGWAQPVVTVYDMVGQELAFADDYRFDPDPVLRFEPPADGVYELEVRDAIYRGREDFVYRVSIGEFPFVTAVYPLGGRAGRATPAAVEGWNLPSDTLTLPAAPAGVHHVRLPHPLRDANPVTYHADPIPPRPEREPNDSPADATPLAGLTVIDGRIDRPGDADVYRLVGRAGEPLVAEVTARRLRSPVDAVLHLRDASGEVVAWNDDAVDKRGHLHADMGVLTHHADPSLACTLPRDGAYFLTVTDASGHGGPAFGYRLYAGPPRPDFALLVGPSSVNVMAGRSTPLTVHVQRRGGFTGPIDLKLKDPPEGFVLDAATVPAGSDRLRFTLTAPPLRLKQPVALVIEGHATIDGRRVTRTATPADDVMQAFLWRHLVPARQMLAAGVGPARARPAPRWSGDSPVRVPRGGAAVVRFGAGPPTNMRDIELRLDDPPPGLSLAAVTADAGALAFEVRAERDAAVGPGGNLIIEASAVVSWKARDGQTRSRRQPLGTLRAVPFLVVDP